MREPDGYVQFDDEPYATFMVYGSFKVPEFGTNFIIVRRKAGRCAWTKKLGPAIDKLVRQWGAKRYDWLSEGEGSRLIGDKRLWDCVDSTLRYEWDGNALVLVPRPSKP